MTDNKDNFKWDDTLAAEAITLLAKKFAYPNEYSDKWEGVEKEIEKFKQSKLLPSKPNVDKQKIFQAVLKTLKNNRVMVDTREDGIYIRLAGKESQGEAFTLHFALAYPFNHPDIDKPILFKTLDGKDIREGEEYWGVFIDVPKKWIGNKYCVSDKTSPRFSTEQAAIDFLTQKLKL